MTKRQKFACPLRHTRQYFFLHFEPCYREYCDTSTNIPLFAQSNPELAMAQSESYRIEPDLIILMNCVGHKPGILPFHITESCSRNIPIVSFLRHRILYILYISYKLRGPGHFLPLF